VKRHTYRATIAYDGGPFWGFSQQRGRPTVEAALLGGLQRLMPEINALSCGGRTDKGVHATGQVISFWSRGPLPSDELWQAIDEVAPAAIALRDLQVVPRRFHASFSATARRYAYFYRDDGMADVAHLDALVRGLVGERCFSAFGRRTPEGRSTVRRLLSATARRADEGVVRFDLRANGFLRRQVRVTVATALRAAEAGAEPSRLAQLAAQGERLATAPPIDADGLYLVAVEYV
jgi:tRNA pseudouridine38-40 synthase